LALTINKDSGNYGAIFTPKIYAKGDMKLLSGSVDFDSSYPTGGLAMDLTKFFKNLLGVMFETKAGYIFEYDYTAKKVKALYPQGGEQVGDGLGGASVDAGATSVTSSAANGNIVTVNAGKAREVANATNLSAVTGVRFFAWGY
jgi:hypothetical protein